MKIQMSTTISQFSIPSTGSKFTPLKQYLLDCFHLYLNGINKLNENTIQNDNYVAFTKLVFENMIMLRKFIQHNNNSEFNNDIVLLKSVIMDWLISLPTIDIYMKDFIDLFHYRYEIIKKNNEIIKKNNENATLQNENAMQKNEIIMLNNRILELEQKNPVVSFENLEKLVQDKDINVLKKINSDNDNLDEGTWYASSNRKDLINRISSYILSLKPLLQKLVSLPIFQNFIKEMTLSSMNQINILFAEFFEKYEELVIPFVLPPGMSGYTTIIGPIFIHANISLGMNNSLAKAALLITFLHEFIHWILKNLNRNKKITLTFSPSFNDFITKNNYDIPQMDMDFKESRKLFEKIFFDGPVEIIYLSQANFVLEISSWNLDLTKFRENFTSLKVIGKQKKDLFHKYKENSKRKITFLNKDAIEIGMCWTESIRNQRNNNIM